MNSIVQHLFYYALLKVEESKVGELVFLAEFACKTFKNLKYSLSKLFEMTTDSKKNKAFNEFSIKFLSLSMIENLGRLINIREIFSLYY